MSHSTSRRPASDRRDDRGGAACGRLWPDGTAARVALGSSGPALSALAPGPSPGRGRHQEEDTDPPAHADGFYRGPTDCSRMRSAEAGRRSALGGSDARPELEHSLGVIWAPALGDAEDVADLGEGQSLVVVEGRTTFSRSGMRLMSRQDLAHLLHLVDPHRSVPGVGDGVAQAHRLPRSPPARASRRAPPGRRTRSG